MTEDLLFVAERWDRIARMLSTNGRITVEEMADLLSVSTSTIRRDLRRMHKKGLLIRTRGGAIRPEQVSFDRSLAESLTQEQSEKEEIGKLAATLVEAGDTVIIDGGATTLQVAKNLQTSRITVITNAVDIVSALSVNEGIAIMMVGGMVRNQNAITYGPTAVAEVASVKVDKTIIGTNGISAEDGLTAPDPLAAEIKATMIARARQTIVVADHTKLGRTGLCRVAPIDAVSTLVTDHKATPEQIAPFREADVEVMVAR